MEKEKFLEVITAADVQELAVRPLYLREPINYFDERKTINIPEYRNFTFYSDNVFPGTLIETQRPHEPLEVYEYRRSNYKPIFEGVWSSIYNMITKIQRADGFFINYPDVKGEFARIASGEELKTYQTKMEYWFWKVCLKQLCIDANGVVITWAHPEDDPTEYLEPKQYIVNSDRIVYFYEKHSIVYKSEYEADVYYSIDETAWTTWRKDKKGKFYAAEIEANTSGKFTVFKLGGVVKKKTELHTEYQSRLRAILPWLNLATTQQSDWEIECTLHVHTQQWVYEDSQCNVCNGMGWTPGLGKKAGEKVPCTNAKCNNGKVPRNPMEVLKVRPVKANLEGPAAPIPPMGNIEKQPEISKQLYDFIQGHIYNAYASVNMAFLAESPMNQSGTAKAYDQDASNNTFYGIATDIARVIETVSYHNAIWRYSALYPDDDMIKKMIPEVVIPNTFDIVSAGMLIDEIKRVKDSGLNDFAASEIEKEFYKKRFPDNIPLLKTMFAAFDLDPASGKTDEQKGYLVANNIISKQDAVVSTYIYDFVQKAVAEDKTFLDKPKEQQMTVLYSYADAKLKEIGMQSKVTARLITPPEGN